MAIKLYLSAGHTGKGTGASYMYGDEGQLTIEFRNLVIAKLKERGRVCYNDNDKDSLLNVINDINSKLSKDDLAIEFHFDASTDQKKHGTSVFVAEKANMKTMEYAEEMARVVSQFIGTTNNGVKSELLSQHKKLGFVHNTKPHALLIELCHISNKVDMDKFYNNKDKLAEAIATFINMK